MTEEEKGKALVGIHNGLQWALLWLFILVVQGCIQGFK